MKATQTDGLTHPRDWQSIHLYETGTGYRVREDETQFRAEILTEIALRFVGFALVQAGGFIWLLSPAKIIGIWPTLTLSALFAGVGMTLFLMSSRGFRRELCADTRRRELQMCKLNAKNRTLVTQRLAMKDIESLYVRRQDGDATLVLRRVGGGKITLMRGREAEVTALHRMICRDMAAAAAAAVAVPAGRRVRPRLPEVIRRRAGEHFRARTPRPAAALPA